MKHAMQAIALICASFTVQAAPIADLHNTGAGLTKGALDGNYSFKDFSGTTTSGYVVVNTYDYIFSGDFPANLPWLPNNETSKWVSNYWDLSMIPPATYTWTTTFDLTGFDLSTASFSGRFAADHGAKARLNGNIIGYANSPDNWYNFSSASGQFMPGLNTLDFNVYDDSGTTGLRVEFLESNKTATVQAVPEPETYALTLAGLTALGFVARRRKAA